MKNFLILSLLLAFLTTEVCAQWKPAGDKIKTQWANKIIPLPYCLNIHVL